jgi:hypothetical protein
VTITNRVSLKSVMAGVTPIADVPDAPTIGAATNVGTSRAFNNGSATVAYTAAPTGGTATTFTATSTPGSFTGTGTSPITVTGLQSATSYTFTVSAANANGTLTSAATSSITATTVPAAPTIGTFTDGGTGTTGTLSFTAGATGGSAITNYSYSTDSSTYTALSPAQTSSPLSLTGLTAGTYNFSVKAINANGSSTASSNVSGTVITPTSFDSIATFDISSTTASVTFTSIPSTYKSLQIRVIGRESNASTGRVGLAMQFNSDTGSNYGEHRIRGNGSTVITDSGIPRAFALVDDCMPRNSNTSGIFGAAIIDVIDYASTSKNKTIRGISGVDLNSSSTTGAINVFSAIWGSTSAINSIKLYPETNSFVAGTTIALYGVK